MAFEAEELAGGLREPNGMYRTVSDDDSLCSHLLWTRGLCRGSTGPDEMAECDGWQVMEVGNERFRRSCYGRR